MSGYEIGSLTGLESMKGPGTLRWTPVRKHFGITAFGVNAYTATEVGQDVVEEHTEERLGHEEMYVVLSGRATFVLDREGTIRFIERYGRGELPDPDKILAEVKKLG